MKKTLLFLFTLAMMASCNTHRGNTYVADDTSVTIGYSSAGQNQSPAGPPPVKMVNPEGMLVKATVFKMSGDYANNVAVTLDNAGNLVYYPAPSDITDSSCPLELGDGWWLDRQGLGANSVFTSYTFEEYSKLPKVPSREELKKAVIPGARVTAFEITPVPASDATYKINEIKEFLQIR